MLNYRIWNLRRQLQASRFRLNHMYKDFAQPLYDMDFVATKDVWRISTNGRCIYFDPDWLQKLGMVEIDFILSHQLMHIALGHIERPEYYLGDRYHLAADIVANGKLNTIGWSYSKIPHIGKIRYETFFPTKHGASITSSEAIKCVPIDPSVMEPAKRRQFMIDSEEWWDRTDDNGENGTIVLCPNDIDPDNLEYDGPTYGGTYRFKKEFFPETLSNEGDDEPSDGDSSTKSRGHNRNNIKSAISQLRQEVPNPEISDEDGTVERYWDNATATKLDWKSLLNSFVQEEVYDYSFTPPDRRMQESDFFLPDYNVYRQTIKNVLFMVDTSGSVSDEMLFTAFDEIKQALEQFDGTLTGTVAFFDTMVHRPTPFAGVEDIRKIKPYGGGGTDYESIFRFIRSGNVVSRPTSIVIITDGEGVYPKEDIAENIPVLWLITGSENAPWGRSITIEKV